MRLSAIPRGLKIVKKGNFLKIINDCSELTTKLHDFSVQEQLMKEKLGFHSFDVSTPPLQEESIPATPPPTTGYFFIRVIFN